MLIFGHKVSHGVRIESIEGFYMQPPNGLSGGRFALQSGMLIILRYLENCLIKKFSFWPELRSTMTLQKAHKKNSVIADTSESQQKMSKNLDPQPLM